MSLAGRGITAEGLQVAGSAVCVFGPSCAFAACSLQAVCQSQRCGLRAEAPIAQHSCRGAHCENVGQRSFRQIAGGGWRRHGRRCWPRSMRAHATGARGRRWPRWRPGRTRRWPPTCRATGLATSTSRSSAWRRRRTTRRSAACRRAPPPYVQAPPPDPPAGLNTPLC